MGDFPSWRLQFYPVQLRQTRSEPRSAPVTAGNVTSLICSFSPHLVDIISLPMTNIRVWSNSVAPRVAHWLPSDNDEHPHASCSSRQRDKVAIPSIRRGHHGSGYCRLCFLCHASVASVTTLEHILPTWTDQVTTTPVGSGGASSPPVRPHEEAAVWVLAPMLCRPIPDAHCVETFLSWSALCHAGPSAGASLQSMRRKVGDEEIV